MSAVALAGLVGFGAYAAHADRVVPSERVRSRVIVRERPERGAPVVASLRPGAEARWLTSVEGWHHVELEDSKRGFVSADWTTRVEDPVREVAEVPSFPVPQPSWWVRAGRVVAGWFGSAAPIAVSIQEPPAARTEFRHPEARLPVSGFAAASDASGRVDLVLVVDASTSTSEFSGADVDGDGRLEDEWGGDDSTYRAQIYAARNFVAALRRLPGNENGERIRVGIVTFAGGEELRAYPPDQDFEPTEDSIRALGRRDAELRASVTSDYAEVERVLVDLSSLRPQGMTSSAAAIGRALEVLEAVPLVDGVRPPAVIDFLTDGMPSLPYAREEAERAARHAARIAAGRGVRINVFELGRNAVTRRPSVTSRRMAEVTGGVHLEVRQPADILEILRATSLTFVERVQLVNRTTGEQTRYISTGVDGSFYGEVPLAPGANEIVVVARLHDGREREQAFEIDYREGLTEPELAQKLLDLRVRNEALIEEIRERLARDMETQRKQLEIETPD